MGKLIVFEGIDGSGKSTQFKRICARLEAEGKDFVRVAFPQYNKPSSALIKMYLGGEFGEDPDSVNAYAASSFYAVDRFASFQTVWREYYQNGGIVLTDRYTTSNAIHQGAKLPVDLREEFFKWLREYEFALLGLPAPDLVLYMDIDADSAVMRMARREAETGTAADIHEKNLDYLQRSAACAQHAARFYGWQSIQCVADGKERTEMDIEREAYSLISGLWGD
ncbi:MAG: thymidylate kinase [Oscillospiraceae bacterium]|nr:thymidylate kinase [Oscillospiraceae bacterium]